MKNFIAYRSTGEITGVGVCQDETFALQGELVIEGFIADPASYYIDKGSIKSKGLPPHSYYTFDYTTKQWVDARTYDDKANSIKLQRDALLQASDWTQLPDVPLDTKEQWVIYRQALRDITLQEGYPNDVEWPKSPEM